METQQQLYSVEITLSKHENIPTYQIFVMAENIEDAENKSIAICKHDYPDFEAYMYLNTAPVLVSDILARPTHYAIYPQEEE